MIQHNNNRGAWKNVLTKTKVTFDVTSVGTFSVHLLNSLKGTTAIPVKFLDGSSPVKFMASEYIYDAVPLPFFHYALLVQQALVVQVIPVSKQIINNSVQCCTMIWHIIYQLPWIIRDSHGHSTNLPVSRRGHQRCFLISQNFQKFWSRNKWDMLQSAWKFSGKSGSPPETLFQSNNVVPFSC